MKFMSYSYFVPTPYSLQGIRVNVNYVCSWHTWERRSRIAAERYPCLNCTCLVVARSFRSRLIGCIQKSLQQKEKNKLWSEPATLTWGNLDVVYTLSAPKLQLMVISWWKEFMFIADFTERNWEKLLRNLDRQAHRRNSNAIAKAEKCFVKFLNISETYFLNQCFGAASLCHTVLKHKKI